MGNAICFEKHDGVDITAVKDKPCDGRDSEGKKKISRSIFYGQSTPELKRKRKHYKRKYKYTTLFNKITLLNFLFSKIVITFSGYRCNL